MPGPVASGPYRVGTTVLCCALPLLTFGVLGMAPSLVLAAGRRRAVDIVWAVVFGALQLTFFVCAGLAPHGSTDTVYDNVGAASMVALWFGAPVHFLVMNRRVSWPAPKVFAPPPNPYAVPGYPAQPYPTPTPAPYPTTYPTPTPYPPTAPTHPYVPQAQVQVQAQAQPSDRPQAQPRTPAPGPATGEDLQQLAELLRRQAQEGRP
ncbi:hypothetical protein GCM10010441_35310 [Kitasatospora paracochleata]|uniref:Integral membrane protein n=1 Tax=Kitasatospora paracochleata TaxID=58354 RepID=A0ABT1IQ94_9ACTN|nr:hypothetical protein [Kitasatospora paracochleata]MCP2307295.1 hypothetical protein [Kitasatospora paracochleata]